MERSSSLVSIREGLISNRGVSDIIGIPNSLTTGSDFEAIIEGIDKEIRNEGVASNQVVTEIIKELNGAGKVDLGEKVAHVNTSDQVLVLESVNESNVDGTVVGDIRFSTGWTEPKNKSKGTKKPKEKGEGVLASDRKEPRGLDNNREISR